MKRIFSAIIIKSTSGRRRIHPREETLPVSVEGTRDVERVRPGFVVSGRAKAIHKAAVGKRGLHKETEHRGREEEKQTVRQQFVHWGMSRMCCRFLCGRCHS